MCTLPPPHGRSQSRQIPGPWLVPTRPFSDKPGGGDRRPDASPIQARNIRIRIVDEKQYVFEPRSSRENPLVDLKFPPARLAQCIEYLAERHVRRHAALSDDGALHHSVRVIEQKNGFFTIKVLKRCNELADIGVRVTSKSANRGSVAPHPQMRLNIAFGRALLPSLLIRVVLRVAERRSSRIGIRRSLSLKVRIPDGLFDFKHGRALICAVFASRFG